VGAQEQEPNVDKEFHPVQADSTRLVHWQYDITNLSM
jgi:hypothetical protein